MTEKKSKEIRVTVGFQPGMHSLLTYLVERGIVDLSFNKLVVQAVDKQYGAIEKSLAHRYGHAGKLLRRFRILTRSIKKNYLEYAARQRQLTGFDKADFGDGITMAVYNLACEGDIGFQNFLSSVAWTHARLCVFLYTVGYKCDSIDGGVTDTEYALAKRLYAAYNDKRSTKGKKADTVELGMNYAKDICV